MSEVLLDVTGFKIHFSAIPSLLLRKRHPMSCLSIVNAKHKASCLASRPTQVLQSLTQIVDRAMLWVSYQNYNFCV